MRLKLELKADKNNFLPHGYNKYISAMIYDKIKLADDMFAQKLHDKGYYSEQHYYKMFTFSKLKGQIINHSKDKGVLFDTNVYLYISSPIIRIIEAIKKGISLDSNVKLHNTSFKCVNIEDVSEVVVKRTPIKFKTMSPIVVSTKSYTENKDKLRKLYLLPNDSDFSSVLAKNLIRKAKLLGLNVDVEQEDVKVLPLGRLRTGAVDFYGGKIIYSQGYFVYYGPPELFNVGYRAGFGERNALGFGMIEIQ
ncbi:MAG: CRISPR-associated endoribonuclease Cas6 [Candidatus Bilamarchaeaceae archaeon]